MKIAVSFLSMSATVFAIALSACSNSGVEPKPSPASASQDSGTHRSANKEVRAYVDPTTGQLREPTSEEIAAENAQRALETSRKQANSTSSDAPVPAREVVLPNGAVEVTLDPTKRHELKACVQANGEIVTAHDCPSTSPSSPPTNAQANHQ